MIDPLAPIRWIVRNILDALLGPADDLTRPDTRPPSPPPSGPNGMATAPVDDRELDALTRAIHEQTDLDADAARDLARRVQQVVGYTRGWPT